MEFGSFAAHAADIEAEPADLEVVALVTDLFADADDDLGVVARFVQGRVFPAHSETKLDIGPRLCYEALARAAGTNVSVSDVEDRLAETGDIGEVATSLDLGGQAGLAAFGDESGGDDLTVTAVFTELEALAAAEGDGSQDEKVTLLFGLFNRCSSEEARYLARLVLGEMRIGVGEGTVRDAIAAAFDLPVDAVKRAPGVQRLRPRGRDGPRRRRVRTRRDAPRSRAPRAGDARPGWHSHRRPRGVGGGGRRDEVRRCPPAGPLGRRERLAVLPEHGGRDRRAPGGRGVRRGARRSAGHPRR